MILRRLGNKKKLAKKILPYFPKHSIYIELFFGAGGMFFNKPLAKYNFLNDIDNDVFNLFMVLKEKKEELIEAIQMMPVHNSLFQYWRSNEETTDIWKAVRFLMLSNFGMFGLADIFCFTPKPTKNTMLTKLDQTYNFLKRQNLATIFMSYDFREALDKICLRTCRPELVNSFVYADPPYIDTCDNYSHSFAEQDFIDLIDILVDSKIKFACSEFDNPFVIEQAKERDLIIHILGDRNTIKSRSTEILITNYEPPQKELF